MRYQIVALDYDGTIAHHGKVTEENNRSVAPT
jgi:hydroxymethylpyrimidine pyrophosphatase-like HAD family hydrolase